MCILILFSLVAVLARNEDLSLLVAEESWLILQNLLPIGHRVVSEICSPHLRHVVMALLVLWVRCNLLHVDIRKVTREQNSLFLRVCFSLVVVLILDNAQPSFADHRCYVFFDPLVAPL